MKFTKEEVSLCKQVAERYKKEIFKGDWHINYDGEIQLKGFSGKMYRAEDSIPLWTISDCLEFFKKRGWWLYKLIESIGSDEFWCSITNFSGNLGGRNRFDKIGKTPLEACLKAVLAMLEEE